MNKKFSWNMSTVYQMPYTVTVNSTPNITVPNYEEIFMKTEQSIANMSSYVDAQSVLEKIRRKFDDKC